MPVGNVIGANATSNIWWMGTLYGAYLFFMMLEFVMLQKNERFMLIALVVVLVVCNILYLVQSASKVKSARDNPATSQRTERLDEFPKFDVIVCIDKK